MCELNVFHSDVFWDSGNEVKTFSRAVTYGVIFKRLQVYQELS